MSKNTTIILEMVEKHGRGLVYCDKCTSSEFKGWKYVVMNGHKVFLATNTQKEMIEKLSQVI